MPAARSLRTRRGHTRIKRMSDMANSNAGGQSPSLLLRGARVVTPSGVLERADVQVERGRIARVTSREPDANAHDADAPETDAPDTDTRGAETLDLSGLTLYPGFVDVHIHGSVGVDLMEAAAEDLHRVARFLASHGVTTWIPTLVPGPLEEYRRAVSAVEY